MIEKDGKQLKTTVVNIRNQEADVYIGRPPRGLGIPDPPARGWLGNPFVMNNEEGRMEVIDRFRLYFAKRVHTDKAFRKAVLELRGKTLGCFCKPKPCHGDIIALWLNSLDEKGGAYADTEN
jgi:hypothetical protein